MAAKEYKQAQINSRGMINREVTLVSSQAMYVLKHCMERVDNSCYELGVRLQLTADASNDAEIAKTAEASADEIFEDVQKELAQEMDRLKSMLENNGIEGDIEYTNPQTLSVPVTAIRSNRFIKVLQEFDNLISVMDMLRLTEVLTERQFATGAYRWQRQLVKLSNRLQNLAQTAIATARKRRQDTAGQDNAENEEFDPEVEVGTAAESEPEAVAPEAEVQAKAASSN